MIPQVFHHVWFGSDELPPRAERMRQSWMGRHPGWEFKLWREGDLGWLRWRDLLERCPSYAQKADIARYEIVERFGGIYLDTDMECLRPLDQLVDGIGLFACRQQNGLVSNSILGARPSHPILAEVVGCLPLSCVRYRSSGVGHQTGPGLLSRVLDNTKPGDSSDVRVFPPSFFLPYDYTEPWRASETFPTAYAVHHWDNSWRGGQTLELRLREVRPASRCEAGQLVRLLASGEVERVKATLDRRIAPPIKRVIARYLDKAASTLQRPMQAVPFGEGRLLVRLPLGLRLLCSVHDLSLSPELALNGLYDAPFVELLRRALRPGMAFVDVGANIGLFSVLAAALVGAGGRVLSYECNPELVELLRQNISMNWLDRRVEIAERAAYSRSGIVRFFAPDEMKMLGSIRLPVEGRTARAGSVSIEVPCERLDDGLAHYEFVDLVKIDVEGAEADVLDGMEKLLSEQRVGMISMEYRLDAVDDHQRARIERHLARFREVLGATFHVPGAQRTIPLDEVIASAHFAQLIVRFPSASIPVAAIGRRPPH
ncbi:MAG TPA: FkbM family methyltransferase [Acidimicrobiales bacterium]|nr:FkbM family methyltransferase [Acidimicrobiales bacterium]